MKYLNEIHCSIGFVVFVSITVVMMIGFSAGAAKAKKFQAPMFDSGNFPDPPLIDNSFMTLMPETAFCYESETEDGTETNEVTVTNCEQAIAGVETIVVRDAVYLDGDLTEDTFDYFAQDEDGFVWYLGEASMVCEDNTTEGSWITGENGAEPGVVMLADPMPGNSYRQEFLEGVAEDMAKVQRLNANVTDYCDKDCLKTKEWSPLERGANEFKYYSREVGGVVYVEELKGGKTVTTELVNVVDVDDNGECPDDPQDAFENILCQTEPPMNCDFNNE